MPSLFLPHSCEQDLERFKSLLSCHEARGLDAIRNKYRSQFHGNAALPPGLAAHVNRHLQYLVEQRIAVKSKIGAKAAYRLVEGDSSRYPLA